MALSMKNTLISLSLSGLMLFAGFLAGEQPAFAPSALAVTQASPSAQMNENALMATDQTKKTKRAFTTPYFSFKKSSLPMGVR